MQNLALVKRFWRSKSLKMVDDDGWTVDDNGRTDAGAWVCYKLTLESKDAGELITNRKTNKTFV